MLGLDPQGKVVVVNGEARRLLALPDDPRGKWLTELVPPGRLRDLLSGRVVGADGAVLTDDHLPVVNRVPVAVAGRDTGSVVTLRDRTELEGLVRELHAVTGLTNALRAQEHEFTNRMHVMAGLLDVGQPDEAARYLDEISPDSHLDQPVEASWVLLTVVGNLVDNAVDAALTGPPPR